MSKKQPRYEEEFKTQIVNLYNNGKPATEIAREYGVSKASVHTWVNYKAKTGSFKEKDNIKPEEAELITLRKEVKQLRMENDILKQAALIMAQK